MGKFDASCGLKKKEIDIIKYAINHKIIRQLPLFPDHIEEKLFLQGRDAWMFRWNLLNKLPVKAKEPIALAVTVKLKKEFHNFTKHKIFNYSCMVKLGKDIYKPDMTIVRTEK